ncbi:MAG TPA: hypothetical protein PK760_03110, partial [Flavobacteriales bacterium]|nr:hypothetical protein [Flavobacteriales bacterium]
MKNTWAILISALAIVSCKKDTESSSPSAASASSVDVLHQLFNANRTNATQSFVVQGAQGGVVFGSSGTVITIAPNAFRTHSGAVV